MHNSTFGAVYGNKSGISQHKEVPQNNGSVIKVMEKSIFIHNIEVPYVGDYIVIDKWKDYKS